MSVDIKSIVTDNFDAWSSTIKAKAVTGRGSKSKRELYGLKKLRELILQLAIRGLLVPQSPCDEPAISLLKRIKAEKERLTKNKKIKKQKTLPPINEEEKLFILPPGWEWARLQEVSEYIQRGKGPKYSESGTVRVISQKCVQWSGFDIQQARYVDESSLIGYQPERYLRSNDLLWNSTGTGTVGRINILETCDKNTLVADSHVTVIRTFLVNTGFLWSYISAPDVQRRMEPTHEKALVSGSTKQVELNTSAVNQLVTPVPPIAEQHRIVAKVNELMALCDQLEQQQENSIKAHETLVESLLNALVETASQTQGVEGSEKFHLAWQRIAENFDILFNTEHSIEQLKQTILQLAVMGKLVPQDPSDESARHLLARITVEKEQLIDDKKIKKQKPLPPVREEEKPFELPTGWEWTKVGEVAILKGGFAYKSKEFVNQSRFQVIRMGNIRPDFLRTAENAVFISNDYAEVTKEYKISAGDILLTMTGTKGKKDYLYSLIVSDEDLRDRELFLNQRVCLARPLGIDRRFLNLAVKDSRLLDAIYTKSTGSANQANIGMEAISNWVIPMPPLSEQQRVIAKVEELIALCENVLELIKAAHVVQVDLTDALADEAIS